MAINCRKTKGGKNKYVVRVRDANGKYFPSKSFDRKPEATYYEQDLRSRVRNSELALDNSIKCKTVEEYYSYESLVKLKKGNHICIQLVMSPNF